MSIGHLKPYLVACSGSNAQPSFELPYAYDLRERRRVNLTRLDLNSAPAIYAHYLTQLSHPHTKHITQVGFILLNDEARSVAHRRSSTDMLGGTETASGTVPLLPRLVRATRTSATITPSINPKIRPSATIRDFLGKTGLNGSSAF